MFFYIYTFLFYIKSEFIAFIQNNYFELKGGKKRQNTEGYIFEKTKGFKGNHL